MKNVTSSERKTTKTLSDSIYLTFITAREADVQLLLMNSGSDTKRFLETVTNPNGTQAWKNKIYILGFTVSRQNYVPAYQVSLDDL